VSHILRLGFAAVAAIVATVAVLSPTLITGSQLNSILALENRLPAPDDSPVVAPRAEDADGVTDLYGNEVSPAVAEYSVDPLGSPYEVHSPQTELPRLASPES